jgi:hypothetical protein
MADGPCSSSGSCPEIATILRDGYLAQYDCTVRAKSKAGLGRAANLLIPRA